MNVLWLIALVIAWLASLGLWYVATTDNDRFARDAADARAELAAMDARLEASIEANRALSEVVGYRDPVNVLSPSDITALQAELDSAKAAVGPALGAPESKVTVQQALAALRTTLQGAQQAAAAAKSDFEREASSRRAAETNVNAIEENYRGQLTTLNQQLSDERQRADNQAGSDSRRFDDLIAAQQASDAAAREAQQALAEFEVKARREASTADATMRALAQRRQGPPPDGDDGRLLSVGGSGRIAYLDVGGLAGVRRGMRFEVLRPGKAGTYEPRGTVEVREVQDDMAMASLIGEPDPLDPLLPGDVVRNPHFEPGRSLSFYLLGEFPLTMSKEFVTARLTELGSTVDERLGTQTDVLVLGDKPLDEDELAPSLLDRDEYKLAERLGVRIVRLAELADYLRY